MLTSSIRSLSDYSSAAGDVRVQVARRRTHGAAATPVTAVERRGLQAIRQLVDLGARFGERPEGSLDLIGSSPEQIDLATELRRLIPARLEPFAEQEGRVDVRSWANEAVTVLDRLEEGVEWTEFDGDLRAFVAKEFEPFLVKLLDEPVAELDE